MTELVPRVRHCKRHVLLGMAYSGTNRGKMGTLILSSSKGGPRGVCGICGVLPHDPRQEPGMEPLEAMCRAMIHRGPDDQGLYRAPGVGLAMRRLSIIDPAHGHQPIHNEDGSLWVVCNGEIYNHQALRQELSRLGHRFYTGSDTEVILHAYETWGVRCLEHLSGMFALALWDGKRRQALLARDRLGEKPLYYTEQHGRFLFASEIKSLLTYPGIRLERDDEMLEAYLTFRYVPGPRTLFQGIRKLLPGHYLLVEAGRVQEGVYWDVPLTPGEDMSEEEYAGRLLAHLNQSVAHRLMSDVPLGLFLSGGLDSSALLALMAKSRSHPVQTFSMGFVDPTGEGGYHYSEFDEARRVAEHFGSQHHEIRIAPERVRAELPRILWAMDEPLGDPTAIPLHFIAETASRSVKVALSGEGSDEIFAGYDIYFEPLAVQRFLNIPPWVRNRLLLPLASFLPEGARGRNFLHRASQPLADRYFGVGMTFGDWERQQVLSPAFLRRVHGATPRDLTRPYYERVAGRDALTQMLYLDTKVWLPEDTLLKADKVSMAHSLELRVPMLDHRLVEFAFSIPPRLKLRSQTVKHILKVAMRGHLPSWVLERRKVGFPTPISQMLGEQLQAFSHTVLLSERSQDRGLFRREAVTDLLRQDPRQNPVAGRRIYSLLVLELWHRLFLEGDTVEGILGEEPTPRPLPRTEPPLR